MTQIGTVTPEQIANEQLKEAQLALSYAQDQQLHLDDVATPLLRAAVPLCPDAVATRIGVRLTNAPALRDYEYAARTIGFTDTLQVTGVVKDSPAERAGLKAGDRIVAINGRRLAPGKDAVANAVEQLSNSSLRVSLTTHTSQGDRELVVAKDSVCDYNVVFWRSQLLNAFSDGRNVYVTSAMMRFAANDDELATIIGHEIGHNAMHHIQAKEHNAMLGQVFGAVLDIVAMKAGVTTRTNFESSFRTYGALAFSQDFEREADYVGLNLVAAAGRSTASSANYWRRVAQEIPATIVFGYTHPTSAERFVRLDQLQGLIASKRSAGTPLRLALKNGTESQPLIMAHASTEGPRTVVAETPPPAPAPPKLLVKQQGSSTTTTSLVDPGARDATRNSTPKADPPKPAASPATPPARAPAAKAPSVVPQSNDRVAVAVVGAPSSDSARIAAVAVFKRAQIYFDRHEWDKAESSFRETLLLDGSQAPYHAALGDVEMVLAKWEEAEAEFTAAMLLDVNNGDYRAKVLEARRRKGQP